MAYEPTIARLPGGGPGPMVEVFFPNLPAAATAVTVRRVSGDQKHDLRGAVKTRVAGALTRVDYEVPFGVPAQYQAQMFNASGASIGWTGGRAITLAEEGTWIHNVLDPAGAVRVHFRPQAGQEISRGLNGEVVQVLGRRVGVLVTSGRNGVTGVTLDVLTDTVEDADKVQALLGSADRPLGGVLCIRLGANERLRLPRPFYAAVLDITEAPVTFAEGGEYIEHRMSGTEASPPAPGVFIPLLTRGHVDAFYKTRAAFDAAYPSRIAADRDYRLVV